MFFKPDYYVPGSSQFFSRHRNLKSPLTFLIRSIRSDSTSGLPGSPRQPYACMCTCSVMSDSLWTPWTVVNLTPLSMEFSRYDYWRGLHFLPQEVFHIQGSNPCLLHFLHWLADSLPPGKSLKLNHFAVHLKLTQHCESTVRQLFISYWKVLCT